MEGDDQCRPVGPSSWRRGADFGSPTNRAARSFIGVGRTAAIRCEHARNDAKTALEIEA
jgi:hypothetical protein